MGWMSILTIFLLITSIVCDDNNATTSTPLSSTTISTTTTKVTSSTTSTSIPNSSITSSTAASPALENATMSTMPTSTQVPPLTIKPNILLSNRTTSQCNCDLTLNCDFNCCCDLDCSDEIVEAFDCTVVDIDIGDFHHGEGLERCDIDSGLFCIASKPSMSADSGIRVPFRVEYSSYRWPNIILEPAQQTQHQQQSKNNYYKYGDAILTYDRKTETFQTINVPTYTIGDNSRCFLSEPVKFLNTQSIKCLRSINELCSYNNRLMLQLLNSQLFHFQPPEMKTMTMTESMTMTEQETSGEVPAAFNIHVESCKHSSDNCTQISYVNDVDGSNGSNVEVLELLGDDAYENVQIEFVVNGTKLVSASAKFTCRNNLMCGNNDELDPTKLIQNIEVRFRNFNDAEIGEKRIRAAPPRGFNDGDIILASRLRPINETAPSSSSDLIFDYFRNDTPTSVDFYNLKLPENDVEGNCLMNVHDVIRFNENSQTKCSLSLTRDENSNFTICQQYQHQLIYFLFSTLNLTSNYTLDGYLSDVFISKFWTPSSEVDSWTRVNFIAMPLWNPEMQESEKIIICSKMVTAATYNFIYTPRKKNVANRYWSIIDSLQVEFEQVNLHISEEIQNINVDIQINVQFTNSYYAKNSAIFNSSNFIHFLCIMLLKNIF